MASNSDASGLGTTNRYRHEIHTHLLVWGPLALFWLILNCVRYAYAPQFAGCVWSFPAVLEDVTSECPIGAFLEQPRPYIYAALISTVLLSTILYRRHPEKLKRVTFYIHFVITLAIYCLTSFFGYTTYVDAPAYYFLPFCWNSPARPLWLWWLVESMWWWVSYLGTYDDYNFRPVSGLYILVLR